MEFPTLIGDLKVILRSSLSAGLEAHKDNLEPFVAGLAPIVATEIMRGSESLGEHAKLQAQLLARLAKIDNERLAVSGFERVLDALIRFGSSKLAGVGGLS